VSAGYYLYATSFPVPSMLAGGSAPTGVTIADQLASDSDTAAVYLQSPAGAGACSLVSGQIFPVNPVPPPPGTGGTYFSQWWPFSFTNSQPQIPGTSAILYFVVGKQWISNLRAARSPRH